MANYKKSFEIYGKEGNRTTITHTWKEPYPKMYYKKDELKLVDSKLEDESKMKILKENLTCYVLRDNYIDNPKILLGYPIVKREYGKDKFEIYPIPQLLTYEGFNCKLQ